MPPEVKSLSSQNLFLDALRSEIIAGSENLAAWIRQIQAQNAIDNLFLLETWLKGIRSFFNLDHFPLMEMERNEIVNRSFHSEIRIVREAILICEACACAIIKPVKTEQLEFEEFIEVQMRKDRVLDFHVSRIVEQLTPSDSVSQLLEFLNDMRITIDALKSQQSLSYQLFLSLGRCYQRELKNCRYIDMLMSQRFRMQYDLIDNKALTNVLRSISDDAVRRNTALVILYLFRFLKYLKIVAADLNKDRPLQQDLVVFSLLHEEMENLHGFLKTRILKSREAGRELRSAAGLIAYSLKTESQRVLDHELVFVSREPDAANIFVRIENSHGLLRNCFQSCIVTLVQSIDKCFDGAALFPSRAERLVTGEKLRQNLWDLRQWLIAVLENREELDSTRILEHLTSFKDSSLQSLMYRDLAEFESFSDELTTSGNFLEIRTCIRKFVSYLEALIQEVSKRSTFAEKQADY
jgi:hypothetical protein